MEDSRGNQVERKFLAIGDNGVPSVGAAVKTNTDVVVGRKNVHNFAFAFIAPLGTEHCDHLAQLLSRREKKKKNSVRTRKREKRRRSGFLLLSLWSGEEEKEGKRYLGLHDGLLVSE
jgi:hypothetical protein